MDRFVARLERKLGRFAIERLTTFIVGGMALVFVLAYTKPEFIGYLTLDPALALKEPWRFVTYLFIPTSMKLIWVIFSLYWTWLIGTNLENEWGAFKLNLYYLLGALGTTAAAWITGMPQGNFWLNTSLFFAFATIFPNYEILVFFIIPIRVKWLALLTAGLVGYAFIDGDNGSRAAIAVAFVNYLFFFTGHLIRLARGQQLQMRQATRRTSFRQTPEREAKTPERACAICGARQDEGADIRVCSCEKCGSPRELCLEHARNH
ncbi:MAG TPA: rhomboid family intramembrane serine protease [Labilithrix sp.]|jgi:membrane associated rhomboid family serine protease|nr:rhomboid family intramembrane serine protease [Labilithrix sp.]